MEQSCTLFHFMLRINTNVVTIADENVASSAKVTAALSNISYSVLVFFVVVA